LQDPSEYKGSEQHEQKWPAIEIREYTQIEVQCSKGNIFKICPYCGTRDKTHIEVQEVEDLREEEQSLEDVDQKMRGWMWQLHYDNCNWAYQKWVPRGAQHQGRLSDIWAQTWKTSVEYLMAHKLLPKWIFSGALVITKRYIPSNQRRGVETAGPEDIEAE
ncbi:hypothetical protein LTR66_013014, partial [Elasticomyces elasticus]